MEENHNSVLGQTAAGHGAPRIDILCTSFVAAGEDEEQVLSKAVWPRPLGWSRLSSRLSSIIMTVIITITNIPTSQKN